MNIEFSGINITDYETKKTLIDILAEKALEEAEKNGYLDTSNRGLFDLEKTARFHFIHELKAQKNLSIECSGRINKEFKSIFRAFNRRQLEPALIDITVFDFELIVWNDNTGEKITMFEYRTNNKNYSLDSYSLDEFSAEVENAIEKF